MYRRLLIAYCSLLRWHNIFIAEQKSNMISNENNSRDQQADNDPSNAMNTKRDVAQSPDEKTDEDFPGYPHYPAKEDIMDKSTGSHRVDANVEEMGSAQNATGVSQRYPASQQNERTQIDPLQRETASGTAIENENDERGVPQNVSNEDLPQKQPGTDIAEAAEKGSLNP
jgi:hypothetical protein